MTDPHQMMRARVRAWLEEMGDALDGDALALDSFTLVELIERAERELGARVPASALTPERFESVDAIAALLLESGGTP
jgi:acyl carrier protein